MCRRESAGVIEALCVAFPEMAAELLPGGQQQVRASGADHTNRAGG